MAFERVFGRRQRVFALGLRFLCAEAENAMMETRTIMTASSTRVKPFSVVDRTPEILVISRT
jgi:hypothetical protein